MADCTGTRCKNPVLAYHDHKLPLPPPPLQEILPNEGTDEEYDVARENVGKIEGTRCTPHFKLVCIILFRIPVAALEAHLQELRERLDINGLYYDSYRLNAL